MLSYWGLVKLVDKLIQRCEQMKDVTPFRKVQHQRVNVSTPILLPQDFEFG